MRILIDLDDETIKMLSHLALDANTDRKNYIQSVIVTHERGLHCMSEGFVKFQQGQCSSDGFGCNYP